MRAGAMRNLVTFTRNVLNGTDSFGAPTVTATTYATWWAEVHPVSGREAAFAETFAPTVSHKATMRYLAGLLPTDQMQLNTRLFAINAVTDPEERGREMVLWMTEIVNAATTIPATEFDSLSTEQFDTLN